MRKMKILFVCSRLATTWRRLFHSFRYSRAVPALYTTSLKRLSLERNFTGLCNCNFHKQNVLPTLRLKYLHSSEVRELDDVTYHKIADSTLDELAEFFENLGDSGLCHREFDVSFTGDVLTVKLGGGNGVYVINKQSPNKQIWLSSPRSGPKRYDIIGGQWRYSHNGGALHDLLSQEISAALGVSVDFSILEHSRIAADGDSWA